jgi:anti-sigma regulatory factor (Ser/Thr protein kinase)
MEGLRDLHQYWAYSMFRITLPDEIDRLDELSQAVAAYSNSAGIPERTLFQLSLVVEELFVNFVSHGLSRNGQFELSIDCDDCDLKLTLRDNGQPFNPLEADVPDTAAPLGERHEGQLGLHLVRQIATTISYERSSGCNVVRMTIPSTGDA